jgi:hypothetical protein
MRFNKSTSERARMANVWIYIDTNKQVGEKDHMVVFESQAAAKCLVQNARTPARRDGNGLPCEQRVRSGRTSGKSVWIYVDPARRLRMGPPQMRGSRTTIQRA